MIKTILLCFIHGFKGDEDTFYEFPQHLKEAIGKSAPQLSPEVAIYPKYETKGDLPSCVSNFREWLIGQVMLREKAAGNARPLQEPTVGVFLVAHSMGGLVATDTLLSILDDASPPSDKQPRQMFPAIQGIITFDTPFVGLSRSMFAYGAFAQYRTISSAYGLVTSVSSIPAHLLGSAGKSSAQSVADASSAGTDAVTDTPAWKLWQTLAMRTGAAGAIAAAGAAAYMNRENLGKGLSYMNKDDVSRGLSSVNLENIKQGLSMVNKEQLQQGFAYMSRENLGQGFAWLSAHLQFVSALMRGPELQTRIQRMSSIEGIGFADHFTSLGPNDMWSGGYFVAERTFCAIPAPDTKANKYFIKEINSKAKDEIEAHMSMLSSVKNPGYDEMQTRAVGLIMNWAKTHQGTLVDHYRLNNPGEPKFSKYTYSDESGLKEVDDSKKAKKSSKEKKKKPKATDKSNVDVTKPEETSSAEEKAAHTKYTYGTSGLQEHLAEGGKISLPTSEETSPASTPLPGQKALSISEDPIAQAGPPEEEDLDLETVPGVTNDLDIEKDENYVEEEEKVDDQKPGEVKQQAPAAVEGTEQSRPPSGEEQGQSASVAS
ncbi:MAG: hypothetical protein M4579_002116 [Chaenotheca gracillima]|nr:MAG: hypothetical protein M4579_002116 [Chaenotheca gracillima]